MLLRMLGVLAVDAVVFRSHMKARELTCEIRNVKMLSTLAHTSKSRKGT